MINLISTKDLFLSLRSVTMRVLSGSIGPLLVGGYVKVQIKYADIHVWVEEETHGTQHHWPMSCAVIKLNSPEVLKHLGVVDVSVHTKGYSDEDGNFQVGDSQFLITLLLATTLFNLLGYGDDSNYFQKRFFSV